MTLTFQPLRVATGSADEEGKVVFGDDRLVAVLVRLSEQHGDDAGRWYLETGFGRLDGTEHPILSDLQTARDRVTNRMRSVPSTASSG